MDEIDHLKKFVEIGDSGCWEWNGYRNRNGYGCLSMNRKNRLAHRASHPPVVRPIPKGKVLHHCRRPSRVNPPHLEYITAIEKTLRNVSPPSCTRRKTSCEHGHPSNEMSTSRHKCRRQCRACDAAAVGMYKTRQEGDAGSGVEEPS